MSETQKHTKPNVPNLRFPGFEGEWEERRLGECCSGFDYGMNAASKSYDGVNGYIRITDIDEHTNEFRKEGIVSPDAVIDEIYRVRENDILFARTGASTGKTYLYKSQDGRLYFAGFLIRANVFNWADSHFVFYQTQIKRYAKWVQIMSMRSGQPGINSQEYASFQVNLPELNEQKKVASFIALLDQRISLQIKLIEDLRILKKAIMARLFQSSDGEMKTLGELTVNFSNRNKQRIPYPMFSVTNDKGFIPQSEQFEDREMEGEDIAAYKLIQAGDIAYNPARINVGSIAQYKGKTTCMISSLYVCIQARRTVSDRWLMHILKSERLLYYYNLYAEGGVRLYLFYPNFSRIKVFVPPYAKQERIADCLDAIEKKVEQEFVLLNDLMKQKKFFLSRLFL